METPESNKAPPLIYTFSHDPSLAQYNVHPTPWITTNHKDWERINTSALVFNNQNRILLVKRAASDSEPGKWEAPGGKVDDTDATILHGCVRELWEESGLVAESVKRVVPQGRGRLAYNVFNNEERTRAVGKFHFEVVVRDGEVRVNKGEHEAFKWATLDDIEEGEVEITKKDHRWNILEAFRLRRDEERKENDEKQEPVLWDGSPVTIPLVYLGPAGDDEFSECW
ncbi:NUDIX hydrolase domain-containing protein [Pochonia chlamydosporia 170]|uniref:NUDIX hydrolase domain-containing protein n=1 Tax=Pochonia chlamydosporia 170 TaxID=1380566 RepID=A0A179FMG4_METCM|nr:NUDIX hydrolase domain-containing protein [Pochonia chlamydosporia 170]OAQ66764.1 NUDIX hydrolase domain-containing protein [Pochonia chlamydosporia 170]